jgi:hypothetical protein
MPADRRILWCIAEQFIDHITGFAIAILITATHLAFFGTSRNRTTWGLISFVAVESSLTVSSPFLVTFITIRADIPLKPRTATSRLKSLATKGPFRAQCMLITDTFKWTTIKPLTLRWNQVGVTMITIRTVSIFNAIDFIAASRCTMTSFLENILA